jgi:hypothetical protein
MEFKSRAEMFKEISRRLDNEVGGAYGEPVVLIVRQNQTVDGRRYVLENKGIDISSYELEGN